MSVFDGMTASEAAEILAPYFHKQVSRQLGGFSGDTSSIGSGALIAHDIGGPFHSGSVKDNQIPQALLRNGSRALQGNLTVSSGVTIDGVDLDVHADDADAHHKRATGGDGTIITADQIVSVLRASQSGLGFVTENGANGLESRLRVDIGAHLKFQEGGNAVEVDAVWDGYEATGRGKALKTSSGGQLAALDIKTRYLRSPDDLTLTPTGRILLESSSNQTVIQDNMTVRTDNWVSGFGNPGWGITPNLADFQKIQADEAHFQALVWDVARAQAGISLTTRSLAILSRDFTSPSAIGQSATLYVEDLPGLQGVRDFPFDDDYVKVLIINFGAGDEEFQVAEVWGQVDQFSALPEGEQSWRFTLRHGPTDAKAFAGGIAWDYGKSGDGYVVTSAIDDAGSPYTDVVTWTGTTPWDANTRTVHTRKGNLKGIMARGDEFGLFAGKKADFQYLVASDTSFETHGLAMSLYDSSNDLRIKFDPDVPSIAVGNPPPSGYLAGVGFWRGNDGGTMKSYEGDPNGHYRSWDGASMTIKGNLLLPDGSAPGTGINPTGAWATSTAYAKNDVVDSGGGSYICNTAHTSAASGNSGPPGTGIYWNTYSAAGSAGPAGPQGKGFSNRGAWAPGQSYVNNTTAISFVTYNGGTYYCLVSHTAASSGTNGPPGIGARWALLAAPGATGPQGGQGVQGKSLRARAAWISGRTYTNSNTITDWVTYNGSSYYCLVSHTSSGSGTNGPPGVGTRWNLLAAKGSTGAAGQDNQDFPYLATTLAAFKSANPNYSGLALTSDFMGYLKNGVSHTYQDKFGNFYFGGNSGNHLFYNSNTGRLGGANASGVTQWYASSVDGKIRAGGGSVVLEQAGLNVGSGKVKANNSGLEIATGTTSQNYLRFVGPQGLNAGISSQYNNLFPDLTFTLGGQGGAYRFNNGAAQFQRQVSANGLASIISETNRNGIEVVMPVGTSVDVLRARYGNSTRALLRTRGANSDLYFPPVNLGAGSRGAGILLGRNTYSGAAGPVPGVFAAMTATGRWAFLWPDNNGNWRTARDNGPNGSTASASRNANTYGSPI